MLPELSDALANVLEMTEIADLRSDAEVVIRRLDIDTSAGLKRVYGILQANEVHTSAVDMGPLSFRLADMTPDGPRADGIAVIDRQMEIAGESHRLTCVSTGNLHAVIFVPDVSEVPLRRWGSDIERAPVFPDRINVHFAEVLSRTILRMHPWERGSGATQACGTGACAVVAAAFATGRTDGVCRVEQPGGAVLVQILGVDGGGSPVSGWRGISGKTALLIGPAAVVCRGHWPADREPGTMSRSESPES